MDNERMIVATRLYVRLRQSAGRSTDAIWMTQNEPYAREVLKLARASPDPELHRLAERFEAVMFGGKPAHVNGSAHVEPAVNGSAGPVERYTGSLR